MEGVMVLSTVVDQSQEFLFRKLLVEALRKSQARLSLMAQNYLARLLAQGVRDTDLVGFHVGDHLALAYKSLGHAETRAFYLRGAEACLLITGLYPEVAVRRRVQPRFYSEWGVMFYGLAAHFERGDERSLGSQLAHEFDPMTHALRAVRITEPTLLT